MTVNKTTPMFCVSCQSELSDDECYICQQCNDEIDCQADEVIGNAEEGNE